jgi:hypothetical protein
MSMRSPRPPRRVNAPGEGYIHNALGYPHYLRRDLDAALPQFRQALRCCRDSVTRVERRCCWATSRSCTASPATTRPPRRTSRRRFIYLLSGQLTGTIDGQPAELWEGQTTLHPTGG